MDTPTTEMMMTRKGPKRTKPLGGATMQTVTSRFPVALIVELEQETERIARETGVRTLNRSDVLRTLAEEALAARAARRRERGS
jgi:hypothetical protein